MEEENKEYSWVTYIKRRVGKQNKNFICSIIGPTGTGKSYTALSIANMIDSKFNIDQVVFSAKEIMDLINSGKISAGSAIIWDEAGIGLSSRRWQSKLNTMINFLLQTFRHRNFVLFFTVPYASFLDSASRRLIHGEFETVAINHTKKTCSIKPKQLQYNPGNEKWYKKYLKVILPNRGMIKVTRWAVPIPPAWLVKEYERKKGAFTSSLNRDISEELEMDDKKGKKLLTDKQELIKKCWDKGILGCVEIGEEIGWSKSEVNRNEHRMRRKGYIKPKSPKRIGFPFNPKGKLPQTT